MKMSPEIENEEQHQDPSKVPQIPMSWRTDPGDKLSPDEQIVPQGKQTPACLYTDLKH